MPGKKAQRLQKKAFALFFAGTAGKSGGKGRAGAVKGKRQGWKPEGSGKVGENAEKGRRERKSVSADVIL